MSLRSESGLLRLAIARGLLRWEDLDSVADHLPEPPAAAAGSPLDGRWVRALVDAGFLTSDQVRALSAELELHGDDLTPDETGGQRPWVGAGSGGWGSRPSVSSPGSAEGLCLAPELRFLAEWPRYRVERLLGAGGMGTVFKAFDPTLGRYVALKFLHRNDDLQTERFLREARAQARLAHPNVCQVHEVGVVEGRPYIAMQYVDGRGLGELCEELPVADKVRIVRDVARAVHTAHRSGLVHRDLKPGNILLARGERGDLHPFVVDFGLAQDSDETSLSRTGMISGTPAYISPEQAQGRSLDHRTDVYSLGIVLYELLAGAPPFTGGNPARILVQLVQEDPKPLRQVAPGIPEDLETIVARCLEKDPARRYESARDLAEDLDRFLEGDPIHARPAGWGYRVGKRLRKNRALTAVSAAAVLALLIVGAAAVRAQIRLRERAELAQRFGRRIGELESSMQYEAFLSRHDVTPHKRRLREEMEAVRSEMGRLGDVAAGPGNFALGQGYAALHRYETARFCLERAWKAGERTPAVATALGEVLTELYERALGDNGTATSEDLERSYRLPALTYLRQAAADPKSSPYVAGLVAYLERRYGDALEAARRSLQQNPGFYKAAQLEAMVHLARGSEAAKGGRYEEARALFDKAGEVYTQTIAQVPSEPMLYTGDCDRRIRALATAMAQRDVTPAEVAAATAPCALALSVDPELADAMTLQASAHWRLGNQQAKRGADPAPQLGDAIQRAERALVVDPHDARAYTYIASSHRLLALWKLGRGADPTVEIQRGIEAAERAVELQPTMASAHNTLCVALLAEVQVRQRRGLDPRPAVEKAAESCEKAAGLDPRLLEAYVNLGNAWKSMAEVEVARGADPSDAVGRAVAAFEKAAHLNPRYAPAPNNLGNVHLTIGEYLLARGDDPRGSLQAAARSYQRAIELNPDYPLPHYNLGYTWGRMAEGLLDHGADPGPALAQAAAALDGYARLNPNDADTFLEQGRCRLAAARWALKQGASPMPELDRAAADLGRAEALNPRDSEALFAQAQVARYRAEAEPDPGRAAVALRQGLDRVDRALAINAGEGRYLALRGLLQYRAARLEPDPVRRRQGCLRAVGSLQQAIKANPLLRREYGATLSEARLETGTAAPPPVRL